ncbi:MAG: ATP-binding protein [Sphingomonas sp.]|nr:ATP-binding protein [Sphingomonas sp.]
MKITSLRVENFRTLEDIKVCFQTDYTALSGANNSGKSNLINAIRLLLAKDDEYVPDGLSLSFNNDFTKWQLPKKGTPTDKRVLLEGVFELDNERDASLVSFVGRYLKLDGYSGQPIQLSMSIGQNEDSPKMLVKVGDECFEGDLAAEVFKRFRDGQSVIYHNSTTESMKVRFFGGLGQLSELSRTAANVLEQAREEITKKVKRATAPQKQHLQSLIGKLSDRLTVEVELPRAFSYMPYNIALSEGGPSVPLSSWGSGTQNRTLILLAMIRAAQATLSIDTTDIVTPIILLEEPESFLHPSAQSEFGTTLITLASELGVQLIVATHSVCLLNTSNANSNLLFERETFRGRPKSSKLSEVSEDDWMQPFARLLGYNPDFFEPWHSALAMRGRKIVLVEGRIDKKYLDKLKSDEFGSDRLDPDIEIFSYDGVDNLGNDSILRLVISLSSRCLVTCDLDAYDRVKRTFDLLSLEDGRGSISIGKVEGNGNIEDLVPDKFKQQIYASSPDLVAKLMGSSKEARSAKSEMKMKICDHFLDKANVQNDFSDFRYLSRRIRRAMTS